MREHKAPFSYMKTERGIYLNIQDSDYVFTVGRLQFYFSSQFYRGNFITQYLEEVRRFNKALNNIYKDKFLLDGTYLALIRLYTLIEKRGFYIKLDGRDITCLEDLHLDVIPTYRTKYDA